MLFGPRLPGVRSRARTLVFKTTAIDHSAIPPHRELSLGILHGFAVSSRSVNQPRVESPALLFAWRRRGWLIELRGVNRHIRFGRSQSYI